MCRISNNTFRKERKSAFPPVGFNFLSSNACFMPFSAPDYRGHWQAPMCRQRHEQLPRSLAAMAQRDPFHVVDRASKGSVSFEGVTYCLVAEYSAPAEKQPAYWDRGACASWPLLRFCSA